MRAILSIVAVAALVGVVPSIPSAQKAPLHLNPAIEKLAQGKVIFGVRVGDLSLENAAAVSRSDVDFLRIDMEHTPMNFDALRVFVMGTIDKAAILKKGNAQASVAPFARFAPYGREMADWVPKQALDIGLMGVVFNGVDDKEQTLAAVRSMRYPQRRGSAHMEPAGLRGFSPTNALWFWGIGSDEYERRADLWPLNPEGDLLCIIMIESTEGLKNIDEIASVPGVGVIWPGAAADLSHSMGVPQDSPEKEAALQTILKSCLAHKVVCGINAGANDIQKRIREGWRYLDIGDAGGGLTASTAAALRAGREVSK